MVRELIGDHSTFSLLEINPDFLTPGCINDYPYITSAKGLG